MDYSHLATLLLLSCSCSAPTLLLPSQAFALLLPYSYPAPFKLLSGTFLAPPQFLPSSCPLSALLCFTLLSSAPALFLPCSCPAHASAPLLLCSSPAPALLVPPTPVWQPSSSSSAPYDFFRHGESHLLWYKFMNHMVNSSASLSIYSTQKEDELRTKVVEKIHWDFFGNKKMISTEYL